MDFAEKFLKQSIEIANGLDRDAIDAMAAGIGAVKARGGRLTQDALATSRRCAKIGV